MNFERMKPITQEQSRHAVAHWRRALTQAEANAAAAAVKKALEDAGIDADVSGPRILARAETSLFGRTYKYREDRCPLWGGCRGGAGLGWQPPFVVARLRDPVKKARNSNSSTVKDLTEIRVKVELTAGFLDWKKSHVKGVDPREDGKIRTKADVERVDSDPRWECEVWDADVYTNGQEREYRCRSWYRYQPQRPFVYDPTQAGLHRKIAATIDWIAYDLKIGKYARA